MLVFYLARLSLCPYRDLYGYTFSYSHTFRVKFLSLVISQRHVSQLQKDVSICIEHFFWYLLQPPNFLELRQVLLRYNQHQKYDLKQSPEAGLLNKRLMLSSSFRCDQIYKYELYYFCHTLLCYLSPTQMFNEPTLEVGLLNI